MGRWLGGQVAGGNGGVHSRMGAWISASSLPHWGMKMCRHRACSKSLVRDAVDINNYNRGGTV